MEGVDETAPPGRRWAGAGLAYSYSLLFPIKLCPRSLLPCLLSAEYCHECTAGSSCIYQPGRAGPDLTPGKKLEAKLNREYGPESDYYKGVRVASAFVHLDDPDG